MKLHETNMLTYFTNEKGPLLNSRFNCILNTQAQVAISNLHLLDVMNSKWNSKSITFMMPKVVWRHFNR